MSTTPAQQFKVPFSILDPKIDRPYSKDYFFASSTSDKHRENKIKQDTATSRSFPVHRPDMRLYVDKSADEVSLYNLNK